MGEVIKIPVDLMKEDLWRILEWLPYVRDAAGIAHNSGPGYNPGQARTSNLADFHQAESMIEGAIWKVALDMPRMMLEAGVEYYKASSAPRIKDMNFFQEVISGKKKLKIGLQSDKFDAMSFLYTASFTYDLFTIFSNLLPTLFRIEKLLTLQMILLAESAHCAGDSHPVASALRKLHAEGLVPWKGNGETFDDGPAVEIFERLKPHLSAGHPAPLDFASFSQSCPSWDAFWQIAAWKAFRMEQALDATVRELLIEAWKCPEKAVSPTSPDPEEPVAGERRWDFLTETEITKPGIPRGGIRPFAYGKGHPVADSLWDAVWDAEHERRSYTDEIPLTFPKDLHTFRCPVPVETKAVREILDRPWHHAAEKDVPDFSNLWGGFAQEAQRILTRTGAESKEEKSFYEDLRKGMDSTYKRGIGMLDHLAGVQEYYRPLRAVDPAFWRDKVAILREESLTEMSVRE